MSGQSEQTLEEVLKSIKHIILVGKGGVAKNTVYDTDSTDSLKQRKEGTLISLRSVTDSYALKGLGKGAGENL